MKVFFSSLTDLSMKPVDAWVDSVEEGAIILDALRTRYADHSVVMRARVQRYQNFEELYIGLGKDADNFLVDVINILKEKAHGFA